MKIIYKFILCNILGWKIQGTFPSELKKYVIIVAPHTHWIDFIIGLLIRKASGVKGKYIAKAALFKPPFGFFFRAVGGTPVDRTKSNNMVEAIVDIFESKEECVFALSPEGTRKKVDNWKTGFYYIAKGAQVPIVSGSLNFEDKVFTISRPFYTTEDVDADLKELKYFFKGVKGKIPEYS